VRGLVHSSMRVLVTGGAGFIGRHISEHFQNRAEVRVLDNLRSGFQSNLSGLQYQLIVGSILDRDLVREAMKGVDFVFHLAAMVSVQESVQNPNECAEINAGGTAIVLEEAALARVKKLIFSSSAAIYGDNPIMPKIESMPAEPKSPYAASKYEGERHCCSFTDERRLATVCLRYFNVFGPYQSPRLYLCKGCSRRECVLRVKIAGNRGLQRCLRETDHDNRSGRDYSEPHQV